jgi:hypothetical protein
MACWRTTHRAPLRRVTRLFWAKGRGGDGLLEAHVAESPCGIAKPSAGCCLRLCSDGTVGVLTKEVVVSGRGLPSCQASRTTSLALAWALPVAKLETASHRHACCVQA